MAHQPMISDLSIEPVLENIELPMDELVAFCQSHPIRKLCLFGSVLRPDFSPKSDVDVLVEFTLGAGIGFIELFAMQEELTDLLGRQVDLLTAGALSRHFRQQVLDQAKILYEEHAL